jgi:hypothetical protein
MIVTEIKINVSFADNEFNDAEADEVIEAVDAIDWPGLVREAIAGILRAEPSTVNPDRLEIVRDNFWDLQ